MPEATKRDPADNGYFWATYPKGTKVLAVATERFRVLQSSSKHYACNHMANQKQIYKELEQTYREGKDHWGKNNVSDDNRDILSLVTLIPHKTILEVGC